MSLCCRSTIGLVAVIWLLPIACAQDKPEFASAQPDGVKYIRPLSLRDDIHSCRPASAPETQIANSPRLDALLRGGMLELSVDDAILLALENNLDVLAASYAPALAETDLLRTKGGGSARGVPGASLSSSLFSASPLGSTFGLGGSFDPVANFGYAWNQSTVPLGITILQGVPVVTTHAGSYSYSLGQTFTTGTSFGISFSGSRQSTTGVTSLFNPQIPTQLELGFTQPLLNGFGRRVNGRFILIARNDVRFAGSVFRQKVMTTVYRILSLYWEVASARQHVEVAKKALDLTEKTLADITKEVQLGAIAPVELVRARGEVSRQRGSLVRARTDYEDKAEQFKTAISKHVGPDLARAEIIPSSQFPEPRAGDVPELAEALSQAVANRPEIEQGSLNVRNQAITIKAARNAMLPRLDIFATYAPQGLSGNRIFRDANGNVIGVEGAGLRDSLSQMFRNQYPDYTAGVSISVPLRNRTAKADLARSLIEQRQLEAGLQQQKSMAEEGARRALIAVTEAKAEIEAARGAVELARQTLDAEQTKFQLGQSDVFRVVLAQRDLFDAEESAVTASSDYTQALSQVELATGTILTKYRIEIGDARSKGLSGNVIARSTSVAN
jgi:outer membrane protein